MQIKTPFVYFGVNSVFDLKYQFINVDPDDYLLNARREPSFALLRAVKPQGFGISLARVLGLPHDFCSRCNIFPHDLLTYNIGQLIPSRTLELLLRALVGANEAAGLLKGQRIFVGDLLGDLKR